MSTLEFQMKLQQSNALLKGTLKLTLDDKSVHTFIASSGLPTHQGAKSWLVKGHGPLPPSSVIQDTYHVSTNALSMQNTPGVAGNFYVISPFSVTVEGVVRGDFGVHFDANVPGSAGCIVLEDKAQWAQFEYLMAKLRSQSVKSIGLEVIYG